MRLQRVTSATAYYLSTAVTSAGGPRYVEYGPCNAVVKALADDPQDWVLELVKLMQRAVMFGRDAGLIQAFHRKGGRSAACTPQNGIALPLASRRQGGSACLVLIADWAGAETMMWEWRDAISRVGDAAVEKLIQLRSTTFELSQSDRRLVDLSRIGVPIKLIAEELAVSTKTVGVRRRAICDAVGVHQFEDALQLLGNSLGHRL